MEQAPHSRKAILPINFQSPHLQEIFSQILLWVMSFWKEEMVLELMKYRYRNLAITITLKAKWLTVSVLDSRVSPFLPSWERDENWSGTQNNLQVSTATDSDAEWMLNAFFPFIGIGSSLVSGTMWRSQSHTGQNDVIIQVPLHSCYICLLFISQP